MKVKNKKLDRIIIPVVTCLIISKIFLFDCAIVNGNSMYETFNDGDVVFMNKLVNDYEFFDIVIVDTKSRGKIIKRVVGTPYDSVQIVDGYLLINGKKLENDIDIRMDYAGIAEDEIWLGQDEYFVLGDNRNESGDSRFEDIGIIKKKSIIGKVIMTQVSK